MPRADETRKKILDDAAQLIAVNGLAGTSMEEVAALAHVAKGSIFYHFGSKEKMYVELVHVSFRDFHTWLSIVTAGIHGEEAFHAVIHAMLQAVSQNADRTQVLAMHMLRPGGDWRSLLLPLRNEQLVFLARPIRELAGVDQHEAMRRAAVCFGAVLSGGLEWLMFEPHEPLETFESSLFACLRGALEPAGLGHGRQSGAGE